MRWREGKGKEGRREGGRGERGEREKQTSSVDSGYLWGCNCKHLIFFFTSIWIFPFCTTIVHSFIIWKLFLSLNELSHLPKNTFAHSLLSLQSGSSSWGSLGPPSGAGPSPFEKGHSEVRQWLGAAPAQVAATSLKRCPEHPGPCESSTPATDSTACGVPGTKQEVALGPGMTPNTVAKINVWV